MRNAQASCALSLLRADPGRNVGVLARGRSGTKVESEWLSLAIAADPKFANPYSLAAAVGVHNLHRLHATFGPPHPGPSPSEGLGRGMAITRVQSRAWADKRVREGIARAR